jgi:hypothetical protein
MIINNDKYSVSTLILVYYAIHKIYCRMGNNLCLIGRISVIAVYECTMLHINLQL